MPPLPAAKKRRIDGPAALRRPFRSPLKREAPVRDAHLSHSRLSQVETPPPSSPGHVESGPTFGPRQDPQSLKSGGHGEGVNPPSEASAAHLNGANFTELQSRTRDLESQLRACRNDIDTLKQAIAIKKGGKDATLTTLRDKWRDMSKAAAEEVFATSQDRVNRMGGVGAWRERERERRSFADSWNAEESPGTVADDDDESTNVHDEDPQDEERDDEKDGEAFTMAMMLRALNIDLDIIGYDAVNEQWAD